MTRSYPLAILAAGAIGTVLVWLLGPGYCRSRREPPVPSTGPQRPSRWQIIDRRGRIHYLDDLVPGTEIEGADLRRADWHDFPGLADGKVEFIRCDFRGGNLAGAQLGRMRFRGCNFSGANLSGVDLGFAALRRCDLSGANLTGVDLRNQDLTSNSMRGTRLRGARYDLNERWPDGMAPGQVGAILDVAGGGIPAGQDLRGRNLRNANLAEAFLARVDFRGADLRGAHSSILS